MQIGGLQKLTVLDYPGKVAATIFTKGCNLRCPFCHNKDLVVGLDQTGFIEETDLFTFLEKRQKILDGVCITGGEPLMHPEIGSLIRKIKALGYAVKLDTNGTFPERLSTLIDQDLLDYVAMDIKSSPAHYGEITGCEDLPIDQIEQSIQILLQNRVAYEFRTTMIKEYHSLEDFIEIAEWIKGAQAYYLQGFVDSGHLIGSSTFHAFTTEEAEAIQKTLSLKMPHVALRGYQ